MDKVYTEIYFLDSFSSKVSKKRVDFNKEFLNEYNLDKDLILYGGLVLLGTCIPLHYEDAERQKRMMEKVVNEI